MTAKALPILISVPHAGWEVPSYLQPYYKLTREQTAADGDVGAGEIYDLEAHFQAMVTTKVARAVVDMNRAADDWRRDGVVKTHTCWNEEIYPDGVPRSLLERAISDFHSPYHQRLSSFADDSSIRVALDCHTMAEVGPPVGPDAGCPRPLICLGDANGSSCRLDWVESLRDCLARVFPGDVTINKPFSGGYITREHGRELPWIQVELSRLPILSTHEKRDLFLAAVSSWAEALD